MPRTHVHKQKITEVSFDISAHLFVSHITTYYDTMITVYTFYPYAE